MNFWVYFPLIRFSTMFGCQDNKLSVCLCDTTGDTDIHINDSLVTKGLAVISFDQQEEAATEGAEAGTKWGRHFIC